MSNVAIQVERLGKAYQISHEQGRSRYRTLQEEIVGAIKRPFSRKSDKRETYWALKDVSFEVKTGEALGIIGRNGAGKSTLLKILSRITRPTTGYADLYGRVGSLLEVGTGFHAELTGRENIFLNGAILGMTRRDIQHRFDEIVAFAEVDRFLDTPVKRYSSGMYMRLAFSVAAHLEPEILVVDEVLAVGDVAFQKKCLGKMGEVSSEGRTVLFVSHNMGAILSLCKGALVLDRGQVLASTSAEEAVRKYFLLGDANEDGFYTRSPLSGTEVLLINAEILDSNMARRSVFTYGDTINIVLKTNSTLQEPFGVELRIKNSRQEFVAYASSWISSPGDGTFSPGENILITIPHANFVADIYYVDFICRIPLVYHIDNWWDSISFKIDNSRPGQSPISIRQSDNLGSIVLSDVCVTSLSEPYA